MMPAMCRGEPWPLWMTVTSAPQAPTVGLRQLVAARLLATQQLRANRGSKWGRDALDIGCAGGEGTRGTGGRPPAAAACLVPGGAGGQDRAGRSERGREDHADQDLGGRGAAGLRVGDPGRRRRLPAAGSPHRRSGRAGQEPDPGGAGAGRRGGPAAQGRAGDGVGLRRSERDRAMSALRPRARPNWRPPAATRPRRRRRGSPATSGLPERVLAPAIADPVGRAAAAGRTGPDPVLGRRDPVAGRADQPPGRRLDRLAAQLPAGPHRRPGGDQPRRRSARARPSPRCSTSTPSGPSSTSTP